LNLLVKRLAIIHQVVAVAINAVRVIVVIVVVVQIAMRRVVVPLKVGGANVPVSVVVTVVLNVVGNGVVQAVIIAVLNVGHVPINLPTRVIKRRVVRPMAINVAKINPVPNVLTNQRLGLER
jgi:hypothetical protein